MSTSILAKRLKEIRGERGGPLTPSDLITGAIEQWAQSDLFFRGPVVGLARQLNDPDGGLRMCMFRQPNTDHYFALPEARSLVLNRLGIVGSDNGGYDAHIRAVLMQALDEEGFEYLGALKPELAYSSFGNVRVKTQAFTINQSRLGKILKTRNYLGFRLASTQRFKGAWCLVPQGNLVQEEVMFEGVLRDV